jgi:hypothetical protein
MPLARADPVMGSMAAQLYKQPMGFVYAKSGGGRPIEYSRLSAYNAPIMTSSTLAFFLSFFKLTGWPRAYRLVGQQKCNKFYG